MYGIIIDIKKPTKGINAKTKVIEASNRLLGIPIIKYPINTIKANENATIA